METLQPKIHGHLVKHYLRIVPLAAIFIILGVYTLLGGLKLGSMVGWASFIVGILIFAFGLARSAIYSISSKLYMVDDMVVHKTGLLTIQENKIPMAKVTDSSLTRNISERLFGLATLNINTSGGISYEVVCEGLDYNHATNFQKNILRKA